MCARLFSVLWLVIVSTFSANAEVTTFVHDKVTWKNGCDETDCYLTLPINITQAPESIFEVLAECARNRVCAGARNDSSSLGGSVFLKLGGL
jgi:hypothetical protein